MTVLFPVPIIIFALLALMFLFFSRQAGGLKAALVASYCGVYIISFTGGASGGIWLAPLFLFLIGLVVIWRPKEPVFGATGMVRLTNIMFVIFAIGIVVGFSRYGPSLAFIKAGRFRTFFGIPIQYLMAVYRIQTVAFLFLAFALPQRYYIDRPLFIQLLKLCWFFTAALAVLQVVDFLGIANVSFNVRMLEGYGRLGVMGFGRSVTALMLITGMFMSFAMAQLTRSYNLKVLAYVSLPIMIFAILCSFSRVALLAVIVGAMSLAITLGGVRGLKGVLISVLGAIVVGAAISQIPALQGRFSFIFTGTFGRGGAVVARLTGWRQLVAWLLQEPGVVAVGVGFQNFEYFVELQRGVVVLEAAHNNFLHILTEFGIAGFLVFISWLVAILLWLISWRRMLADRVDKMIPGIFISLMLALAASCLTQETLAPSPGMITFQVHFYLLLGIFISYYRTQMMELDAMWQIEYADYDGTQQWGPETQASG